MTLIDKKALHRYRCRAQLSAAGDTDFLLRYVADELAERLATMDRSFETVIDLNSASPAISEMLKRTGVCPHPVQTQPSGVRNGGSVICDDEFVPFKNASCDLIISALTLQFVNDLPGLLVQIRRALKPGGLFLGMMIGGSSLSELRDAFLTAEVAYNGGASARILPFIDVKEAGQLLQRAGFHLPVADIETLTVRYADPVVLMKDLRSMAAANCLMKRQKNFLASSVLAAAQREYVQSFSDQDGRVRATFDIIALTAWGPRRKGSGCE